MRIYDCGANASCHDLPPAGDDFELAVVSVALDGGRFTIRMEQPLVTGQRIYVADGCTDDVLSPPATVWSRQTAPLASPAALVLLLALLGWVGWWALLRLQA